ncbi:conserved phage C-terminal domain-containing protein [Macrococcoides caseolyticum]|uniref:conserved phage C-terminal domain-containing protein n=1 Tax=Macrococcoides caseolyticum TaxID=69966 RepID=UPI000C32521A|nr:conserved phage C-terminal domain-containing protein [Macrococcus caseolyticus]PKE18692.1 alpha/beta hydrolase [Macrococcus caseolyticus]PKF41658.1 alpha/beta hydrolase [Macrococcus caseolyticus]
MNEQPSYYAILPAKVRYDNRLTADEKIMFSEITALSNKWGYCTASNGYFSKLYEVAKETTSRRISKLNNLGYLSIEFEYEGKQIKQRRMYPIDANVNTPIDNSVNTPIDANVKENNTSINTINNNILSSNAIPYEQIINYLNDKAGKNFKHTTEANKRLINGRYKDGYTLEDFMKVIDNKVSQWKGTDSEMYLRPKTLFSPSNFEGYLNEVPKGSSDFDINSFLENIKE